ncbi:hypothetical protein PENSTE_c017G01823 [Penicillium steckii]|uniref:Enoyl reductase (ER) domain-containing protein n=1 Tax=Penicillium steckii TaxID=303698 RepID=A0A1V6SXN7_9EURO|nr:hypothetical protein PENSTE_c017G01823 [Penicillium steckii]
MDTTRTHKAIVYDKPGEISTNVVNVETPTPGPGEVLVKITHSGWKFLPEPIKSGQVGGHEGVGTVAQIGPSSDVSGIKIGDRVGIKWIAFACGNCVPCLSGADGVCVNQKISGFTWPGTFQQYVLAPAHYVTPIPGGLSSEMAAPLLCGGVTVYSALKKSQAKPGDWVVIAGAGGGLGHLGVQLGSRGMGLRIIGLDIGSKENFVKGCGAEVFIDITKCSTGDQGKSASEMVMDATGGAGASAVIICSASNAAYAQGLDFLKFNGTLVCVGVPGNPQPIENACPHIMVSKQLRIVGSTVGNRKDAIETLDMAKRVVATPFQVEKPERIDRVFGEMRDGKLQGRVVLDLQSWE